MVNWRNSPTFDYNKCRRANSKRFDLSTDPILFILLTLNLNKTLYVFLCFLSTQKINFNQNVVTKSSKVPLNAAEFKMLT